MENDDLDELMLLSSSSPSSSDSEDDWYEEAAMALANINCRCYYRHRRPRVQAYMETVIVGQFIDADWREHFRLRRFQFQYLLDILMPHLQGEAVEFGRQPIPPEKQLMIALSYLATPDCYRSITHLYDVGKATGLRAVDRVVEALYRHRNFFISWPSAEERRQIAARVEHVSRYPGVFGFLDGFHTKIEKPSEDQEAYMNRKRYPSLQTQVAVKPNLVFFHAFSGYPGSVHDSRVFTHSGIQQIINTLERRSHILADSAYSLQEHVMVPYRYDGPRTREELYYNRVASGLRQIVERAIELLKMRWRILLDHIPLKRIRMIPNYITACIILHNICLIREGDLLEMPGVLPAAGVPDGPLQPTPQSRRLGEEERHRITKLSSNNDGV